VRRRLADWRSDQLPAFGRPTGVVVNYGPDRAVAYDMAEEPRAVLARAQRLGHVELTVAGRPTQARQNRGSLHFKSGH
jgi:hypothetical protein